ncbi:hypothetical protein GFO_2158 [Christiangramia forsetii KT0803]|uniref:Uncharacterized protein n=1 Tax=Christiangramia forsetii (strain DSM 17595 / CGMCC 1.15422 / KT0803) TaxID=411154 RepID=A0M3C8_CHRFK|nr:hypothetical protein GFO_2158 [Christiangramia forsetii KT0803]
MTFSLKYVILNLFQDLYFISMYNEKLKQVQLDEKLNSIRLNFYFSS